MIMKHATALAVAIMLAGISGNAAAANKWDPWAYCWAQTKGGTKFLASAPTQIAGSDFNGIGAAWKAYAAEKLGAALDRAECRYAYTEQSAPEALQMQLDEWKTAGKQVELTGWVWAP
jgi:hypothetical protein